MRSRIPYTLLLCITIPLMLSAQTSKEIPFTLAKGYFVKNTFSKKELRNPKITDQNTFDHIFGMATVMGEDGKPTPIDFHKIFVIAVIEAKTDLNTSIAPLSLKKIKKRTLLFSYKVKTGIPLSYTIRPCLLILVDKSYQDKKIILEKHLHTLLSEIEP